jgi:Zn-dependent alcohol dehydrogenase
MEQLVERLVQWKLHPEELITDRYSLDNVSTAFEKMAEGKCGKVAVVFD